MNIDILKKKLTEEGYIHVFEWTDAPDTEYPVHAHKGKVVMYVMEGDVTFWFGKKEVVLKRGDRFDVPIDEEHSAHVGPLGYHFLVGEMIKNDS